VFERNGKPSFGMKPTIRDDGDDGDVAVGRDRFEHGHGRRNVMFIFRVSLTKDERVMEEYHLPIHIFHHKEGICCNMDLFIPSKVRYDRKINSKEWPSNGLDLRLEPKTSL
jgi:hypothetical protein